MRSKRLRLATVKRARVVSRIVTASYKKEHLTLSNLKELNLKKGLYVVDNKGPMKLV